MINFADRVKVTVSTTGTGTVNVGTAQSGFQAFPSALNSKKVRYGIVDGTAWELGEGVYTHSGTTLTRVFLSSSTGSLLNLGGNASLFITPASVDIDPIAEVVVTVANPGSGNKFYLDGQVQQGASLTPNVTYRFDQSDSTNSSHPLKFSTTSDGTHNSGSEYTTNVTSVGTPGSAGSYTEIRTEQDTAQLYYYCSSHSGMGGSANNVQAFAKTFTLPTSDGSSGQALTTNASGVLSFSTVGGGGVTVVANITALEAISSPSEGALAYVTGTKTLFIRHGSGGSGAWYKIATVTNAAPTSVSLAFSGGGSGDSSSYELATDETATTVTGSATDPEGLSLSWSFTVGGGGSLSGSNIQVGGNTVCTISQSTNVFTMTPHASNAGDFSVTFSVTDGVNAAVDTTTSFTLAFKITNSKYTSLLVQGSGSNDGTNSAIADTSASTHSITVNGSAHQGTRSPYRAGGHSVRFDGSDDTLTVADSTDHIFTGAFTVEFWVKLFTNGATDNLDLFLSTNSGGVETQVGLMRGSRELYFYLDASIFPNQSASSLVLDTWTHVIVCRNSSNSMSLFSNGTRLANLTNSSTVDFSNVTIGGWHTNNNYDADCLMTDLRFSATNEYNPDSSSITVPTSKLEVTANTKLLMLNAPGFFDKSGDAHAITLQGVPAIRNIGPYDYMTYNASGNAGSIPFDGNDSLVTAASSDFTVGTGQFTVEAWVKFESTAQQTIFCLADASAVDMNMFYMSAKLYVYNSSSEIGQGGTLSQNVFHHLVVQRDASHISGYVDGTRVFHNTNSNNFNSDRAHVAVHQNGSNFFTGIISSLRFVSTSAVYSGATLTIPFAAPLTAVTNTKLLLNGTAANIKDLSQNFNLALTNDAKVSNNQTLFSANTMSFDGGDTISFPLSPNTSLDGDFTIEGFFRPTSITAETQNPTILSLGTTQIHLNATSDYITLHHSSDIIKSADSSLSTGTWQYFAISRSGTGSNNISMYLGTSGTASRVSQATSTTTFGATTGTTGYIGTSNGSTGSFIGFLQDIRITKDYARYSGSSMTIPTSLMKG